MVREWLKIGRDNAVGRFFLRIATKQSDREVRKEIEEISETETPVLNMMDGNGYFIPADSEGLLVLQWMRTLKSYRKSLDRKIRVCELWLARHAGQMEVE